MDYRMNIRLVEYMWKTDLDNIAMKCVEEI